MTPASSTNWQKRSAPDRARRPSELLNAGLLGNKAQTIVVAPLEYENVAFGVLLVGQEKAELRRSTGNGLEGIGSFARSVAPDLHAWLLLRGLREQLASRGSAPGANHEWCGHGAAVPV